MPSKRFSGTILPGHKEHAVLVPFDPASAWRSSPVSFGHGRKGHPVTATVRSIALESFVVARARKHWLLLDATALEAIGAGEGDTIAVTLAPREATRGAGLREVLALLRRRGALRLVDLAEAVAGEPIAGSWWAHPKGHEIYRVGTELESRRDVVVAKLAGGKVTYVHARLVPALLRVVGDRAWRSARIRRLDRGGKRALAEVEAKGSVRADAATKKALEATALVRVRSEHTEQGRHATVLESWRAWAPPAAAAAALELSLDEAHASLADAGVDLREPARGLTRVDRR